MLEMGRVILIAAGVTGDGCCSIPYPVWVNISYGPLIAVLLVVSVEGLNEFGYRDYRD